MKTIKQLLALLALTSTLSFGTVYSDGEDGTTTGWRVYDNSPAGATVENSYDEAKQSKVIVLNGDKRKNSYMLGDKKNSKGWKNSNELTMKWSMNFNEKFKISVYIETKKGSRVLYYDGKEKDKGIYKKRYIRLGLGSESKSGKWIDISRNLEADLQKYEPSNYIKMVSGIKIQGSGKIDNVELIKSNGQPVGDLQISDIEVIKLEDDYAKVAWKLNHKANGQVEYGTSTDYGSFSKKADNFKFNHHRQSLRGLETGTTYHYRVISEDATGNRAVSEDKTFTTTGGDGGGGADNPPITLKKLREMIQNKEDVTNVNTSEITDMHGLFSFNTTFNQDISHWDVSNVTNMSSMFNYAASFNQPIGNWDVSNVTDMRQMFYNAKIFNQPIGNWDVSNVKTMSEMFWQAYVFNQDIGKWDVSKVTTMRSMFYQAKMFNKDIGKWDVSQVTNMNSMFADAYKFNQPLGSWNLSNVTRMGGIFSNAKVFNQDIGNWNTSKVTNMERLFHNATLFNQDISDWDISSATTIDHLLVKTNCSEENYKNIYDKWSEKTTNKQVLDYLKSDEFFYKAYPLQIPLELLFVRAKKIDDHSIKVHWKLNQNATGVVEYGETTKYGKFSKKEESFKYSEHNQTLRNLTPNRTYHYRVISKSEGGFTQTSEDKSFFLSGDVISPDDKDAFITTWKITNKHTRRDEEDSSGSWFFYNDKELRIATNPDYKYNFTVDWGDGGNRDTDVTKTITHKYEKEGTYKVTITGLYPKPEKLCIEEYQHFNPNDEDDEEEDYEYYYYKGMQDLIAIDQWGTQQWKSMNKALYYCENLKKMDTKAPNLSKVTDANSMFRNTYRFNQPLNHWDVSSITDMGQMFSSPEENHSLYTQEDDNSETYPDFNQNLNSWDVSHVTNMKYMFAGLRQFNTPLSQWDVSGVKSMDYMFFDTRNFNQDISSWDVSHVTSMEDMFYYSRSFNQDLSSWDVSNVSKFQSMLGETNISVENYDKLLKGWSKLNLQPNIKWWGYELDYSEEGKDARQYIIDTFKWDFVYG